MSESPLPATQSSKPQRVLACVLCQNRKIRCDRNFPCINCTKSKAQCVPATLAPRRRRQRFPERELLERVRKYEDLLRENNIAFEPLHKNSAKQKSSKNLEGGSDSGDDQEVVAANRSSPSTSIMSEKIHQPKNIWHAMSQGFRDPDNDSDSSDDMVREVVVKKALNEMSQHNDHILFGSRNTIVDLSTLHPEPVQIFRLWQIYLENVNPLFKVTHAPSLQGRIIEASSNITAIDSNLEVLMFSIYCISILSLTAKDCQITFRTSQEDLLTKYQFGCQQALLNCGFLRSGDRDCLTAFYLYLVSVRPSISPQSLSSMLGIAIRIANRIGIHSESTLSKCTPFEAEMRRRLWWSLMLFDSRVGELSDSKASQLVPTWDCKIPLNVNDSHLRPDLKELPVVQSQSTEAIFAVVRSEVGNFLRHAMFHLEYTCPSLKSVAKEICGGCIPGGADPAVLEKIIEDKYLKFCDPQNPLHFMTLWMTRGHIAKIRLLEHNLRYSDSSVHQTDAERDRALAQAIRVLECDTKYLTSPLTKGYLWLVHLYYPFPAYIHILQDLRRRPFGTQAELAWEILSDNYDARFSQFGSRNQGDSLLFGMFTKIVLQAWEARGEASGLSGEFLMPPRIVSFIRHKLAEIAQNAQISNTCQPVSAMDAGIESSSLSIPIGPGSQLYNMEGQDWSAMDWGFGGVYLGDWNAEL